MPEIMQFRKRKKFFGKQKKERLQKTKQTVNEENVTSGCPHSFGYLAVRPKNDPISQKCLFCLKLVECLYKNK